MPASQKPSPRLPPALQQFCSELATTFREHDHELYLVGGSVRDALLASPAPPDLDFATSAPPQVTERALRSLRGKVFKIGEKFGTIGAVFGDIHVEITTYRAEAYEPGSRKPAVTFRRHLQDDLARRDFTINAIALDPRDGQLHDPFDGCADLARGIVRAVGNPEERFAEDPLRLLRAARFAARLHFIIDEQTSTAIQTQAASLASISRERVRDELDKLLLGPMPSRGIAMLCSLGLAEFSLPDVPRLRGMVQESGPGRHKDVFSHTLQVLDRTPPRLPLRWAGLLHDIAKPATKRIENGKVTFHGHDHKGERMARRILTDLHQPSELIERVGRLVGLHLRANAYEGAWTDSAVRRFVRDVGDDLVEDALALSRADVTTGRVERRVAIARSVAALEQRIGELRAQEDIARLTSPLDGLELMALFERGPGPWIKPIKDHLTEMVIDGELSMDDKEAAVPIARRLYEQLKLEIPVGPRPDSPEPRGDRPA